ncbi:GH3 auxin-responsive promoter family protein [Bremerella cremea]|uniref:GH3 auxin-responsive promoter family protein n=1 Tax=Bremerella cremea TaxID=1031537 RepID=UPI0031E6D6E4
MIERRLYVAWKQHIVRRFRRNAQRAASLQRELLFEKLRREADSDFGREHGLDKIRTVEEFRRQLPLANYEYYRPYVERVKNGDVRALYGPSTKVLMFAMTSGTTSASKYIPVTNHFFREYRRSWNVWGLNVYKNHPELLRLKTLQFSSDWQQTRTPGGYYCGNISGLAADTRPWIANLVFMLPTAINKISDAESKQYTALRLAMARNDVGIAITANPLTLIGLARMADQHKESLIRDIHNGSLSSHVQMKDEIRRKLNSRIGKADPRRARELEQMADREGHLWPRDYWPQMSVLAIWTGAAMAPYVPQVQEYFGDVTFRDHGLSASEGRMTTPLEANCSAGVLDVSTHYFEFIPEEEHGSPNPTILEAHELEQDRNYFLVMSTSSALWRHDIHDVVKCVGFEGQAPILDFMNKGAHYSSMTGEKLSENQVVNAVRAAMREFELKFEFFTLAPVFGDPPHYELLVEGDLDATVKQQFAEAIDRHLAEMNCEYDNRIETGRMHGTVIRSLPPGSWTAFHNEVLSREGASLEQFKHPCLTNKLDFIDRMQNPSRVH